MPPILSRLFARGRDGLEGAKAEVEKSGGKALVLPTDVAEAEQVEEAAEGIGQLLGPVSKNSKSSRRAKTSSQAH